MRRFSARFPAVPLSVRAIRREVEVMAIDCGLKDQDLADVRLAVSEAATNAVVHGSAGSEDQVSVAVEVSEGEMLVVVADDGEGSPPRIDSPGAGLGLPIMSTVARRVDIRRTARGTEVHMAFPCPAAVAA
jgi:stage II sporulation protein AB (anti-sigma F factor)